MQKPSKQPRLRERPASIEEAIRNPLGHLTAHYPFPARLNEKYLARLRTTHVGTPFSKGVILFAEGEEPTGVYVVLDGCVKISSNSTEGKSLLLGFFGPGTILGLAPAILGRTHEATAEVLKPAKTARNSSEK